MTLGGVLLACFGIILIVLVANGRWPNVWNAALGGATTPVNNAGNGAPAGSNAAYTGPTPSNNALNTQF